MHDLAVIDDRPVALDPARLLMPDGTHELIAIAEGITVAQLIERAVPAELRPMARVYHAGTVVEDWDGFTLRAGDKLLIAVVPQGGKGGNKKGIIGSILTIAVAVFAAWVVGPGALALTGWQAAAVQAGITLVGAMAISALVKPPTISTGSAREDASAPSSYSLTGQSNAARPFGSCLVVYGRHRMMPALAANPDIDNHQQTSMLTALYDFGLGWLSVEDLRVGDVSLWEYSPDVFLHQNSYCQDMRWATRRVGYDQYAITMVQNDPVVIKTKIDTIYADLDIQLPKGIFQTNAQGQFMPFTIDLAVWYRPTDGSADWVQVPIDNFWGGLDRSYTLGTALFIQYGDAVLGRWTDYDPTTSPAVFRQMLADQQGVTQSVSLYRQSIPNPSLEFLYPDGPIDEASYWARYPDARGAWPAPGTAQQHFESIGSREGRDPGVRVWIKGAFSSSYDFGWYAPYPSDLPTRLHWFDSQMYGVDPHYYDERVGGWKWINSGASIVVTPATLWLDWRVKDGYAFDGNLYYQRYPDVAAAGVNAWEHFTKQGAFEGRDPYPYPAAQTAVHLTAQAVGPYWLRVALVLPRASEYEVKVVRTDQSFDGTAGGTIQKVNVAVLGILRSYQAGPIVQPRLKHTMLELRVRASDQLQGVIQNLSAIVTSVLRVFWYDANGVLQSGYDNTRNPAWIALDILTSEKNPRALRDDQIDWPSWVHLANKCNEIRYWTVNGQPASGPRYMCDIVVEDFTTVKDLVESVLSGCRSSLILTKAGTWGVLHDEEKTVPRQLITPANSWDFSGQRTFAQIPHALHVGFINRDNAWTRDEVVVYNDGYNASNATVFETLDTFGITDYAHAWAYGRYMLAQGIQRAEIFTVMMDVENLLVQRGDMVYVAHDVPDVGGVPARVVDVVGNDVTIDQVLTRVPTGYAVRLADGTIRTGAVTAGPDADTFTLDNAANIAPDDLIVLGDLQRQTFPYLVQSIAPASDLTAQLTLCKYEAGVYQADQGAIPPWEPGFGNDYIAGTDLKVTNVTASSRLYYIAREPRTDILLQWQTTGFALDHHEITVILPSNQRVVIAPDVANQSFQWTIDALRDLKYYDIPLQFEIVPVSTVGFRGVAGYVTITIHPDRTAPAEVPVFGANVQKETVDLFWQHPDEPDIGQYEIRYTPNATSPSWEASQQLAIVAYPTNKVSTGARTGAYGLRAWDTSGNQSPVAWRRTTVAVLPDVNVIEVVNDEMLTPAWPGKKDHVVADGRELRLEGDFGSVYPDGIYYMRAPVDLGDVYEVRVSSKIEAFGLGDDDYMHSWPTLHDVPALITPSSSDWDCWLELRTSDTLGVLHEWPTMHDVDPIGTGSPDSWSPWRPVTVGDFTAQLLQFRIRLESRDPNTRVVVRSGRVEVDMPDRVDTYGDLDVPAAGLDFFFPVAFRELEAVAITINGNPDPVVADVTNKSPLGLTVRLRNTQTSAYVPGSVDIMAEGYGRQRPTSI